MHSMSGLSLCVDSVPHSWMIKALELAKVLNVVIKAIEQPSHQWETIFQINEP